jgi:hypothetical protein
LIILIYYGSDGGQEGKPDELAKPAIDKQTMDEYINLFKNLINLAGYMDGLLI